MPAAPRATSAAGRGWGAAELLKSAEGAAVEELKCSRAGWMLPLREAGLGRGSPGFLGGLIWHPFHLHPWASLPFLSRWKESSLLPPSISQAAGSQRSQLAGSSEWGFSHLPGGWHTVKG